MAKFGGMPEVSTLCSAVTSTGAQTGVPLPIGNKTFQGSLTTSSGAGSATVKIQGTNDLTANTSWWDDLATLTLSDTASDSASLVAPCYQLYRANITAISGTGAAVTVRGSC